MQSNFENLATNRIETRFVGTTPLEAVPEDLHEVAYPDSLVSSLYFGASELEDPVPSGVALRFRYRAAESPVPEHKVCLIDPDQAGTLELKLKVPTDDPNIEQVNKYYAHGLRFGEVAEALANPSSIGRTTHKEHALLFEHATEAFQGQPTQPLILAQAVRRHFLMEYDQPIRLTLDTDNSLWVIGKDAPANMIFASRAHNLGHTILEVKSPDALDALNIDATELLTRLFGESSDFVPRVEAKRGIARTILRELGVPTFMNPEFVESTDRPYAWSFHEREMKLQADGDPRDALLALPAKIEGVYLSGHKKSDIRFRNRVIDGVDVIEKGLDDDFTVSVFQHKVPVKSDQGQEGQLIRTELTEPTIEDLFNRLGRAITPAVLSDIGRTEGLVFGTRHRIGRNVVSATSGNLFVVLADHCQANDDRPPLDQIEIEHIGKLAFPGEGQLDPEAINQDFSLLRSIVQTHVGPNCELTPTTITKQAWLDA